MTEIKVEKVNCMLTAAQQEYEVYGSLHKITIMGFTYIPVKRSRKSKIAQIRAWIRSMTNMADHAILPEDVNEDNKMP